MSRVFVAQDTALGRAIVVKVLHPDLSADLSLERFRREIRVGANLQHPHIVPLLAAGEAFGLPYFTMPYIEGSSLRVELQQAGEFPVRKAVLLLREVASALAYSHAHGVIHRDIKPENVLISAGVAMVTDFGVAKALDASTAGKRDGLTSAGLVLGTPAYMAPEQIMADGSADSRTDIYAFGLLAYELLTGSHPFAGRSGPSLLAAQITAAPEPIDRRRPRIPPSLAALVMRCLEKRPADRPQSASEIVEALEKVIATESDVRPGHRSRKLAWIAAATVAIGALSLLGTYVIRNRGRVAPAAPAQSKAIAVMPFVNLSSSSGDEYFSDGMTEELIDALSRLPGLRVAARSSVVAVKRSNLSPREIARQLGVTSLVEGTVRRAGNRLRISAQLVDPLTGYSLWAERYDRDARDVFAIQDEISRAIVGNLRLRLSGQTASLVEPPTENIEAHNLFLQGRFFQNKRTGPDIERAISLFSQAIRLDSTYARAYAALSIAYNLLSAYASVNSDVIYPKALVAARRALALDSTLAEAHAALGVTELRFAWDEKAGEREFRRAIELDSTYSQARSWYAQLLDLLGQPDSAIAEMREALRNEPLSLIVNTMTGVAFYQARRFREAEAAERKALDLDTTFVRAHRDLGWALLAQRRFAEAEREFATSRRLIGDTPGPETAYLYAVSGRRVEAEAMVRSLEAAANAGQLSRKPRYGWETALPLEMAMVEGVLGNRDRAFYWLDRAYTERLLPIYLRTSPQFDSLRADPRFEVFVQRVAAGRSNTAE